MAVGTTAVPKPARTNKAKDTRRLVIRKASLTSRKTAELIANFASEKKALDIIILDMRKVVNFCDYFVICSGNTSRQVHAIAEYIDYEFNKLGRPLRFKQGFKASEWVVFDAGDVVVHVFQKDVRAFYGLEYLWQGAKEVKVDLI
ncbi:MAG: ribosome silencing factor [Candidatus Omnitrophica bacterium]|nr:ribosome silencing factor [Candidatus Omnitrophota bacterium]